MANALPSQSAPYGAASSPIGGAKGRVGFGTPNNNFLRRTKANLIFPKGVPIMETPETLSVNGKTYRILKLLGKGKGGYSYLVTDGTAQEVFEINRSDPIRQEIHRMASIFQVIHAQNAKRAG